MTLAYKLVLTLLFLVIAVRLDRGQTDSPDWPAMVNQHYIMNDQTITADIYNLTGEFMSTFRDDIEKNLIYQQLIGCPYNYLCSHSSLLDRTWATPCCHIRCRCEYPECLEHHTCCLDIYLQNMAIGDIEIELSSVKRPNCVAKHLAVNEIRYKKKSAYHGVFMLDSCPVETDAELRHNCTRDYQSEAALFQDITPVTNTWSGIWYRNIYCAYCNGVDDNLTSSDIELTCSEKFNYYAEHDIIEMVFDGKYCDAQFIPKSGQRFHTCIVAISECNTTGRWIENIPEYQIACEVFYAPILVDEQYYRNVFCALCNDVQIDEFVCDLFKITTSTYAFPALLKLENHHVMNEHKLISGENNCTENQHYDHIMDVCRDIICSPMMPLNNGQCMEVLSELRAGIYTLYLKAHPLDTVPLNEACHRANFLASYLKQLPQMSSFFKCAINVICHTRKNMDNSSTGIKNRTLEYYKIRFRFGISLLDTYTAPELFKKLVTLQNFIHTVPYHLSADGEFNITIEIAELDPKPFDKHWHIFHDNNSPYHELYHSDSLVSLQPEFENDFVRLNLNMGECTDNDDSLYELNVLHFNNCSKVLIKSTDYTWTRTDKGFVFLEGDFTLSFSDAYVDINGDLAICTDTFSNYLSQGKLVTFKPSLPMLYKPSLPLLYKPSLPLRIVSVTSSALSIVSLVFTLAVFLLFPRLRLSFPGYLNISLVLVLVCAQCLYLISSMGGFDAGSSLCIAVGILLHYFRLLSILWMNICTYHIFYVITQISTVMPRFTWGLFIKYHVYALVMALIPVVVNISVSMATTGVCGYGDATCYISSQDMVLYTFGIPVLIIILSNITMYFVMVYKIRNLMPVDKNVKNERNDFLIFVKLSTVTGATWIFGFIYMWTDLIVMSYLFILLNAGQGIFIMFAFVLNRRVINMFRTDVLGRSSLTTNNEQKTI